MLRDKRYIAVAIAGCLCLGLAISKAASHGDGVRLSHGCEEPHMRLRRDVANAYDRHVLELRPVLYLTLGQSSHGLYQDASGNGHNGAYEPRSRPPGPARLPNGAPASEFNGHDQYVQVGSARSLSVTHTGCLTVETWMKPATLQFPREEGSGYAYVLGKGSPGKQEYALRMYSLTNTEVPVRPNRISAYAFNPEGGEGSGAYFQDPVSLSRWIMVAFTISIRPSQRFPDGYLAIYKDGQLRGRVSLDQFHVKPAAGNAPFRIATRNLDSFFKGVIGNVAVYDYALSTAQIARTYKSMFEGAS
jgi:hypothetical protein